MPNFRLVNYLKSRSVPFREVSHAPEGRCDFVSKLRGNTLSQATKAMVFMSKKHNTKDFHLVVIPGDKQIDFNYAKKYFHADTVLFAPKDKVIKLTDCELGAIPPFSFKPELKIWIDESIKINQEIVFNAGCLNKSIFMKTDDYLKCFDNLEKCLIDIAQKDKTLYQINIAKLF